LGAERRFFFFNPERSSLTMGGTFGGLEHFFQLGNALGLDFELLS
jgi:hypothetical protein